jgi:hypothetical protein
MQRLVWSAVLPSMYLSRAEKFDKDRAESWKADADGILIYVRPAFLFMSFALQLKLDQTGLFVAGFVVEGLKILQRDPGSSSVDLHAQISQQLATFTNASQPSVVLTFPDSSPFYAPISALLTNTLWLLSLIVSPSCALLAILLQQWARCYLLITQNNGSKLHDRVRPVFFCRGRDKIPLSTGCRGAPRTPSHICLFLFLGTPHLHL